MDVHATQVTTRLCITEHKQKRNFHWSPKAPHFCNQSTCLLGFTPTSLRMYGNCCSISSALMLKSLSAHFCFSVCTTRPKTFPPASIQTQHPRIYVFTIKTQCAPTQQYHNCTAHILYRGTTKLWISSFMGNLEVGSITRDFERQMKEGSGNEATLSVGALWGEPRGRAPLLGTPKDMLSKALEMGVCLHRGPFWRIWGDVPLLGSSREG